MEIQFIDIIYVLGLEYNIRGALYRAFTRTRRLP